MAADSVAASLLSIIVSVFNEAATIERLVSQLHAALARLSYEVILVDDGSTDGTTDRIHRFAANGCVIAVSHASNQGKGAAIRSALKAINGDVVIIQDADLEYDPEDIPRLI